MWNFAFRLAVLRWIYDRAVDHLALGVFLVGVVGIAGGFALRGMSAANPQGEMVFGVLALAAAATVILRWRRFAELKHSFETALKSFLYRFARTGMPLGGAPTLSGWAQMLVSEYFSSISYKRKDQIALADKVAAQLKLGKRLFVIEGDSGVGKTAAAAVIIDRLICDSELSHHVRKVYYLDLAVHGEQLGRLLRQASSNFLRDASLVVDNFHRIPSKYIEMFGEFVQPGRLQCEMMLILSQPREYITLCPEYAIGPFKLAEADKTAFRLSPPEPHALQAVFRHSTHFENISGALNAMEIPSASPLRWLSHVNLERLYQMTLDDLGRAVESVLLMRKFEVDRPGNRDLLEILAVISVLAIHRGAFTASDLRSCLVAIAPRRFACLSKVWRLKRCFNRLRRHGLVIEAIGQRRVYVFHQALAEHLKDRLKDFSEFLAAFSKAGEKIRQAPWVSQDPLMSWLYDIELGDHAAAVLNFPQAMFSGAYGTMRRALLRNPPLSDQNTLTYERAILAERVGDWGEARKGLALATANRESNGNAWAWATIAAVEAAHTADSRNCLQEVIKASDVADLPKLAARYWLVHMDAHDGIFDIDALWQLIDQFETKRGEFHSANKFEFVHLARRVLFDCARFLYLIGDSPREKLHQLFHRPLALYLQDNHPYYEAYRQKFFVAHSLHYQYLYELCVLRQVPSIDDEVLGEAQLHHSSEITSERLAAAAIEAYQSAIDRFAVFGDKTADYIRSRLLEVRITQDDTDLDKTFESIVKYTSFIKSANIADLNPYPYIYYFKFHIRQAWKLLHQASAMRDSRLSLEAYDAELAKADDALRTAKTAFGSVGNRYGVAMCCLLEAVRALFDADTQAQGRTLLAALKTDVQRLKYRRIEETIGVLEAPHLTSQVLYAVIAYFPFIHQ